MKHFLHTKSGVTVSTGSIHVAHFPPVPLSWDSGRELSSEALGGFHFYEMNELFYASGVVRTTYYPWKN